MRPPVPVDGIEKCTCTTYDGSSDNPETGHDSAVARSSPGLLCPGTIQFGRGPAIAPADVKIMKESPPLLRRAAGGVRFRAERVLRRPDDLELPVGLDGADPWGPETVLRVRVDPDLT